MSKEYNFWAEMRSTAYLFSKSPWPTAQQTGNLINELSDILGKRITTYPPTFAEFGIGPKTPYELKRSFLGLDKNYNNRVEKENEIRFQKFMLQKAAQAQKANWTWRITQEAEDKQEKGWYPFFVTLTVDPKMTDPRELWEKGRELRKYIRSLAKISAQLQGHPPPHKKTKKFGYRPESDYVTYAGVIEHGKTQEHHHGHFMIWMKNIPSHWKTDPNQSRLPQYRTERECKSMRYLWPWAIASQKPALYFRSKGDIWSTLGHVTPTDKKTGKPIEMKTVTVVGNYVTKYMQKGNKIWNHKMKCTRGLGLQKIKAKLDQMTLKALIPLSWKPHNSDLNHSASSIHSVPLGLMRSMTKQKIFSIRYQSNQLDLKALMKTNYGHYERMLKSVRDGARPDRMPLADLYDWVQKFLPEEKEYCKDALLKAHQLLAKDFPRPLYKITPTTIGANEIGFTYCI